MTTPLVDPQLAAFWDSDPSRLTEQQPLQDPEHTDPKKLVEVGIALAAAFLLVRHFTVKDMQKATPQMHDSKAFIKGFWRRHVPLWMRLAVPAIKNAYELGLINGLSEDELEAIAQSYAEDLGEYINETSSEALLQGFYEQVGEKWSAQLAWQRSAAAYGLDAQQMRAYVRSGIRGTLKDSKFELLPQRAQDFINTSVLERADRLGGHEAWHAMEAGKAVAWLHLQNSGKLPTDAQKEWLTAADERVCIQCGPLNRKRVGIDEQWVTPDGNKYWSPGIHPNCRCDMKLLYPETRDDPWQSVVKADWEPKAHPRGQPGNRGQFRRVTPRPVAEVEAMDPQVAEILRQAREQVEEEVPQISPFAGLQGVKQVSPFGGQPQISPFAVKQVSPFSQSTTGQVSPFATTTAQTSPFARTRPRRVVRQILVLMPGGGYADVPEDKIPEGAEPKPVWVYTIQHHSHEEGYIDGEEADAVPYVPGVQIDFDYDPRPGVDSPEILAAAPYERNDLDMILDGASGYYSDANVDNVDQGARDLIQQYNGEWTTFSNDAKANIETYVRSMLGPDELLAIIKNAGLDPNNYGDLDSLQNAIIHRENDSVEDSYLQYLVDRSDVFNDYTADLQLTEARLAQEHGLQFHTPQIFMIPKRNMYTQHFDSGDGHLGLAGQYTVKSTKFYSANEQMLDHRPANIKGIRIVELEPAEEAEDIIDAEILDEWDEHDMYNGPRRPDDDRWSG